MYSIHSTAMLVSLPTVQLICWVYTEASYEQRNHDSSSCPYDLMEVDHGGGEE